MSCTSVLLAEPVPPSMPTVSPALMCRSTPESAYSAASARYLKETPSKSTLPSATSVTAPSGEESAGASSSTSPMRRALARERVSIRKTLEMSISEFMTCRT